MGLFDKLFNRNKVESNKDESNKVESNKVESSIVENNRFEKNEIAPLSETSFGKDYLEKNMEEFANTLELSYKDFLMAVADRIVDCNSEDVLYGILDVAKKVEAEIVADKDPESKKRLKAYKETVMASSKKDASKGKIQALNEYEHSLFSEIYKKYCLPEVRQQIAKIILVDSGVSPEIFLSNQQKLDAVIANLCIKQKKYEKFGCPDPYADKIYGEMLSAYNASKRGYKRESHVDNYLSQNGKFVPYKSLERNNAYHHEINMFNQKGLDAISKELGITNKTELRDLLINRYIKFKPEELGFLTEKLISGNYPGLSLKELMDIVPSTKVMSNKEFCSFVCSSNMDHGFYNSENIDNMFEQANRMLEDTPENNTRKNAWKEFGVSLNEVVTDIVLANGGKYVDTYFEHKNMDIENKNTDMNKNADMTPGLEKSNAQKTAIFKNIVVKNMQPSVFRQNYPALSAAIHEVAKSDPATYKSKIADLKKMARDNVVSMYYSQGLKAYLENKDPWNSLHPTQVSTIVNNDTYIAYERDKENTPTFYVFGKVDQKMLKDINDVIAERLKQKDAPEGKEYHIVITAGKSENTAYKASLGKSKSLVAIEPSEENKETRRWLQAVVKYKVDNGYEKYLSKPKSKGPERVLNQSGGRSF